MKTLSISSSLLFVFLVTNLSCFRPSHSQSQDVFFQCLDIGGVSGLIYTPSNSSYLSILKVAIDNRRFASQSTHKPFIIITPELESHIQTIVLCCKQYGIQIKIRSGGHDFEGLSYRSVKVDPFVLLDLFKMNKITIDASQRTAWVQAGATLGQLYYKISTVSQTLAFSGGFCPTIGVGGHFSGGGFGQLFREYGLAADNVIDARLINVDGNVLDGDNMGSDLFWAIRGGGGGSFGIVTAWKVNLVYVPQVLTYFSVNRTLEQNVTELVHKWQLVTPNLPNDIYSVVTLKSVSSVGPSGKTVHARFVIIGNGGVDEFLALFAQRFPELGASRKDCNEVSWIQSLLVFNGYPADTPPKVLASRIQPGVRSAYKRKSDFVQEPITYSGLEGIWNYLYEVDIMDMHFVAGGGVMDEIPESALPYPHRAGYLFETLYAVTWDEAEVETPYTSISLLREFYHYMTPYVSKSPRVAYVNYKDLDLGVNDDGTQIPTWGFQYFGRNFIKLMEVKTRIDPGNFFRHEQSIPTIPLYGDRMKENSNLLNAIS